jgi:GTP-binding protein HflX
MVHGNTQGLRRSLLERMEQLYDLEISPEVFATRELLDELACLTDQINREIAVYITRSGEIVDVFIGTNDRVALEERRIRRGHRGLSGVRCVHTHPGGAAALSELDKLTLHRLWLDAMAAVAVHDAKPQAVGCAVLADETGAVHSLPVRYPNQVEKSDWMQQVLAAEAQIRQRLAKEKEKTKEKAFLVSVGEATEEEAARSLEELARLADTAGAEVCGKLLQRRQRPDNATYIGSGKLEDLMVRAHRSGADVIVFDDELSGIQLRNLEDTLGVRVIDRTMLILDIFSMRAQTREGKLQVELAQQIYRLPRLLGMGTVLSRLGGGIGTRGPGEKQLEVNRRHIRRRITELERDLTAVQKQRDMRRARRVRNAIPVVALVGYTNAGKSTLLNTLSGSDVLAEDKLFATLDAVSRRVVLPHGHEVLFVDTVGFINKLPHTLVRAFQATLEEVVHADLLLHILDASDEEAPLHKQVVEEVLQTLGAGEKPSLLVYNKADKMPAADREWMSHDGILISAKSGSGIENLLQKVETQVFADNVTVCLLLPHAKGALRARLHESARVVEERFENDGIHMTVEFTKENYGRFHEEINSVVVS